MRDSICGQLPSMVIRRGPEEGRPWNRPYHEIIQNLATRLGWPVAWRDDRRLARRLSRQRVVDGVYRLGQASPLDDLFPFKL
jgi:hypothetical protein